jgi:hypothetical protein
MSILSTFPNYINLGGYDKINELNIDLKNYDKLYEIEVIDKSHPFISFLKGFSQGEYASEIYHGWYHKPKNIAKFYVTNPSRVGNLITCAWIEYAKDLKKEEDFKNQECEKESLVTIYSEYCGSLYESNEFDIDKKVLYKNIINKLIDKLLK